MGFCTQEFPGFGHSKRSIGYSLGAGRAKEKNVEVDLEPLEVLRNSICCLVPQHHSSAQVFARAADAAALSTHWVRVVAGEALHEIIRIGFDRVARNRKTYTVSAAQCNLPCAELPTDSAINCVCHV